MSRDMQCRELIDFLWRYLGEELTPTEKDEFESHLARCPSCVAYMNGYQTTIRLGAPAFVEPEAPVPDEVPEDLVRAIVASRRRSTTSSS